MEIPYNTISKLIGGKTNDPSSEVETATSTDPVAAQYDTIESNTDTAVEHAKISRKHEEKVQHKVEKERHEDHYHTTIQPLKATEVEPEEHKFKQAETVERSFDHEDSAATQAKLKEERSKFQDTVVSGATEGKKTSEGEAVVDEHVHRHLHETVQPVIEKEIIKPSVTHTTVPVHETHQDESVVHSATKAKPMSVEEFKEAGNPVTK